MVTSTLLGFSKNNSFPLQDFTFKLRNLHICLSYFLMMKDVYRGGSAKSIETRCSICIQAKAGDDIACNNNNMHFTANMGFHMLCMPSSSFLLHRCDSLFLHPFSTSIREGVTYAHAIIPFFAVDACFYTFWHFHPYILHHFK